MPSNKIKRILLLKLNVVLKDISILLTLEKRFSCVFQQSWYQTDINLITNMFAKKSTFCISIPRVHDCEMHNLRNGHYKFIEQVDKFCDLLKLS